VIFLGGVDQDYANKYNLFEMVCIYKFANRFYLSSKTRDKAYIFKDKVLF